MIRNGSKTVTISWLLWYSAMHYVHCAVPLLCSL